MGRNEFACQKHVNLLPDDEKIGFGSLISELFRRDVSQSKLLRHNIPEEKENKYIHRGIIFLSITIQVVLSHIAVPLKWVGSTLENILNSDIVSGFRKSKDGDWCVGFLSFLGHLDIRAKLDQAIQPGDARYYPALSMMAAKLAYESESVIQTVISQQWKMEFMKFYNFYNEFQKKWTTQAYMFREGTADNDIIFVVFRGTSTFVADDWSTDFDLSWCKIDGMGKLHRGFMIALGLKKYDPDVDDELCDYQGHWPKEIDQDDEHLLAYYTIRERLREILANNKKAKFIVTGHSLGGALAILFPAILALHGEWEILNRLEGVYTYGQPRVGDEKFGRFMKNIFREHHIKYFRIVYGYDVVPTIPWDNTLMTFKHFGTCIHFNGFYRGKIVHEQRPFNRYEEGIVKKCWWMVKGVVVTIIEIILSRLYIVWELIRSFVIAYTTGPEYREGWVVFLFRVSGILFPGPVNHNPRDYVNSTRLASQDLFLNYDAITTTWE